MKYNFDDLAAINNQADADAWFEGMIRRHSHTMPAHPRQTRMFSLRRLILKRIFEMDYPHKHLFFNIEFETIVDGPEYRVLMKTKMGTDMISSFVAKTLEEANSFCVRYRQNLMRPKKVIVYDRDDGYQELRVYSCTEKGNLIGTYTQVGPTTAPHDPEPLREMIEYFQSIKWE